MPIVYEHTTSKGAKLGVWDIQETLDFFSDALGLQAFPDEKLPGRIAEKLAVRLLLNHLVGKEVHNEIRYDAFGKPYLENQRYFISFSHKKNHVAVIVSTENPCTGIDIETVGPLPLKLLFKYQNANDLDKEAFSNEEFRASLLWSAKECLYKVYGKKELDFAGHMTIEYIQEGLLLGKIHKNGFTLQIPLRYVQYSNYVLTYTE